MAAAELGYLLPDIQPGVFDTESVPIYFQAPGG
jgi:hypothetical protein